MRRSSGSPRRSTGSPRRSTGSPRRGRYRFLYQFSLRTLLLAMAAVAVLCNWYFQPRYHEEELAGKDLRLRRQIKTLKPSADPFPTVCGPILSAASKPIRTVDPNIVSHGNWSLLDGDDLTLVRGRYHENAATGRWTAWYPTGGKAAEGKMQQGVKVGRWRTWYEDGTLASDITFTDRPVVREKAYESYAAQRLDESAVPVRIEHSSSREGTARGWYESGELQYEGRFTRNQQDGMWAFYDKQGRVTKTGSFRGGLRHGQWTITRSVSEGNSRKTQMIRYIDGRTEAELNGLLASLQSPLASNNRAERYAALIDLAELGEGGVPQLLDRLDTGDELERVAIVGMVPRMPTGAQLLLPRVREFLTSDDDRLAHQVRLTLFQIDPTTRDTLFQPLLTEAQAAPVLGRCLEEMTVLYRYGEPRRGQVFAALMALSTKRDDADKGEIAVSAAELGGDVTPYLLSACEHEQAIVRLQAARTLGRLVEPWYRLPSFLRLEESDRQGLVERLKKDPSADVRKAAEDIQRPPPISGFGCFF